MTTREKEILTNPLEKLAGKLGAEPKKLVSELVSITIQKAPKIALVLFGSAIYIFWGHG